MKNIRKEEILDILEHDKIDWKYISKQWKQDIEFLESVGERQTRFLTFLNECIERSQKRFNKESERTYLKAFLTSVKSLEERYQTYYANTLANVSFKKRQLEKREEEDMKETIRQDLLEELRSIYE